MYTHQWVSTSVEQTQAIAEQMAQQSVALCDDKGLFITLEGDLGAGKTAFSQGFIRALLPQARVRSPTFSLIESYELNKITLHHLDLYRLQDPEELEYLGLRDLFWHSICLIEWANRGSGWLPLADIALHIVLTDQQQRQLIAKAQTDQGQRLLSAMRGA